NRATCDSDNSQEQDEPPAGSDRARARDRGHPWLPPAAPGLDRSLASNSRSAQWRDMPKPAQNWDPTSLPLGITESHPLGATSRETRGRADKHRRRQDCSSARLSGALFLARKDWRGARAPAPPGHAAIPTAHW